jgi:hypothetical protein
VDAWAARRLLRPNCQGDAQSQAHICGIILALSIVSI